MLKKEITYADINEQGEEIEVVKTLRFAYTLAGIKLYEQHTGRNFFDDSQKSVEPFSKIYQFSKSGDNVDLSNLDSQTAAKVLPILFDPSINRFLVDAIPAFYAVYDSGHLIQDESSYDEAYNSMWLMDLVNIEFFADFFGLITKTFGAKQSGKKSTKK